MNIILTVEEEPPITLQASDAVSTTLPSAEGVSF